MKTANYTSGIDVICQKIKDLEEQFKLGLIDEKQLKSVKAMYVQAIAIEENEGNSSEISALPD